LGSHTGYPGKRNNATIKPYFSGVWSMIRLFVIPAIWPNL
jgi:hypothetical protein